MVRRLLPNWVSLITVVYCLQAAAVLAENRRDIKIPCGGATVTEQIALKVNEAGATWTVRVFAESSCQFSNVTAIASGVTPVAPLNWNNNTHVAQHVTEMTYEVRVTDQAKEGRLTISGTLEPRPGNPAGLGGSKAGQGSGSGQPATFSVTFLLRVVELEFTAPANGAPLSVCVGGSANLSVLVRVGDGRPPSAGTVTWQVSTGLPGTTPSPTPLQGNGFAETTFTSNGSLTSGAGTITAQAKGLKDADGKPMPDVSASVAVNIVPTEFAIQVTAFIPEDHIKPFSATYGGDGAIPSPPSLAGFTRGRTSFRLRQYIIVIPDQALSVSGEKPGSKTHGVGPTRSYDAATSLAGAPPLLTAAAKADTLLGAPLMIAERTATPSLNVNTVTRQNAKKVQAYFRMAANNPLVDGSPDIDWEVEVYIDVTNPSAPTFRAVGKHDGYPAYDIYINDKRVHHYDPRVTGETVWALGGSMDKTFDNPGTLP